MELWMELQWQLRWQLLRSARSRNSPTPAGFKPNLSKNQPPKNCLTSPSDAHKKDEKQGQRQCLTSPDRQLRKHEKTMQKPCSGWSCGWSCNGSFGGSSGTVPKQPNPSRIQAQPVQKPAPEKLPNVAFWRPQERWRKANANAWHHQTGSFESVKKPCKNHVVDGAVDGAAMAASVAAPASVRHGAETAKPQQDSSPTCPKTSPRKTA